MDKSDISERIEIDKGWITAFDVLNDINFVVKKEDYQRDDSSYYATYFVFGVAIIATAFYGYY